MVKKEIKLKVEGMHCISCVSSIEEALKELAGVSEVSLDFSSSIAYVVYDDDRLGQKEILKRVSDAGYNAEVLTKELLERSSAIPSLFMDPSFLSFLLAALLTIPLMVHMFATLLGLQITVSPLMQLLLASIVQFWSGRSFYRGSYFALKAKAPNMDLLIAVGTTTAYLYSFVVVLFGLDLPLYFETSAAIITIVLLGRWIEGSTKHKATEMIEKLLLLVPKRVQVEREGRLQEVDPDDLKVGEIFYVRPGENVAVDGKVLEGESSVDEALLTGESLPVSKEVNSLIYSGSVNQQGLLKAQALRVGEETTLAKIVQLVERLHLSKAPIQRLADQVSALFVPLVLLVGLVTLISWWVIDGSFTEGLIAAVATIVVACPCALGIATPLAILVASGKGAELGLIFQNATAIETCAKSSVMIFDKTGTLTIGKPEVTEKILFGATTESEAIQTAVSLEAFSSHPLASSILSLAKERGIEREPVSGFHSISGKGVEGIKRGKLYHLGSRRYAEELGCEIPTKLDSERPGSELILFSEKKVLAAFYVSDPLRSNSKEVVEALKEKDIEVLMISGDSKAHVESVAKAVGIEHYLYEVLPEKKVDQVMHHRERGKILAMCGDGINDAPALAAADIGFSIGSGSDIAIAASDVTLIHNDLMGVVDAIELSQETIRKIKQNLFLAFSYNTLAIPIAALGWLNPIIAAAAMSLSSISVVINSLLFKRFKPSSKRNSL